YTDGITEARNAAGEEFGEERLTQLVSAGPWADAETLRAAIFAGVAAFVGEAQPFDDMTVLVVMRDASPALG
ncbi:MAG TPA: SpoIIE family protein phosphatase, partial [Stenomitos sp.]